MKIGYPCECNSRMRQFDDFVIHIRGYIMDQFWTVYKTICLVNTKFYLGIHKTKNPNDDYLVSGTILKRAIKKYGRKNFSKCVLFIFNTKKEADLKEIELIGSELTNPKCYNLAAGGECGWEYVNRAGIVSRHWRENRDSRRKAISIAVQKKWADPEHYKTHAAANGSLEAKKRQSRGHINQWKNMSETQLLSIKNERSTRWDSLLPEQQEQFKLKMSQIKKSPVNRNDVMVFTDQHPELTYKEIGGQFNISGVTVQRIYHKEFGRHRNTGQKPGKYHHTPETISLLRKLGKDRFATEESRIKASQHLKNVPKSKIICDKCGSLVGESGIKYHQTGKFSCIRKISNRKTICVCGLKVSAASLRRHQTRKGCLSHSA